MRSVRGERFTKAGRDRSVRQLYSCACCGGRVTERTGSVFSRYRFPEPSSPCSCAGTSAIAAATPTSPSGWPSASTASVGAPSTAESGVSCRCPAQAAQGLQLATVAVQAAHYLYTHRCLYRRIDRHAVTTCAALPISALLSYYLPRGRRGSPSRGAASAGTAPSTLWPRSGPRREAGSAPPRLALKAERGNLATYPAAGGSRRGRPRSGKPQQFGRAVHEWPWQWAPAVAGRRGVEGSSPGRGSTG